MVQECIQAVVTMLAVINPAVTGMILLQITQGESKSVKLKEAGRSSITVFVILLKTSLLGKYILKLFGISIESFRIVGGIVIAYIGFAILAEKMQQQAIDQSRKEGGKIDNAPLVMFAASPGTIATLTTISFKEGSTPFRLWPSLR